MTSITPKSLQDKLLRHLDNARSEHADSLEKLSSGSVFTTLDPRPADRAISDKLDYRLRSLASAKRNINDAFSLLETAEAGMSEIGNMITRMKEINIAAASSTVSDNERRLFLLEYEALFNEINRISQSTSYNGIPLLDSSQPNAPKELSFRLDQPSRLSEAGSEFLETGDDIHIVKLDLGKISTTPDALGLVSAREILEDYDPEEGIPIEDLEELLQSEDSERYLTKYDQAIERLSEHRAVFGAMQTRFHSALNYIDVYQENISAAKSRIADTDVSREAARLLENKILMSASTSLMGQTNLSSELSLNLLHNLLR